MLLEISDFGMKTVIDGNARMGNFVDAMHVRLELRAVSVMVSVVLLDEQIRVNHLMLKAKLDAFVEYSILNKKIGKRSLTYEQSFNEIFARSKRKKWLAQSN